MSRISREQLFMDICDVVAKRSTCGRQNVGAVLVNKSHNIVSMGYNGPLSGEPHCTGNSCQKTITGGCYRSIHAEENALSRYLGTEAVSLYCSLSPCIDCARNIKIDTRVKTIYYRQEYRDKTSIAWLAGEGIKIYRLTPAGHLLDAITNELITSQPEKMPAVPPS